MKPDFVLTLVLFLATAPCDSATLITPPAVQWQQSIGGTAYDQPIAVIVTPDGGFVFAGTSISGISGNKTSPSHDTNL